MRRLAAAAAALALLAAAGPAAAREGYLDGLVSVKEVTATSTLASADKDEVPDRRAPWRVLAPLEDPKLPAQPCGGRGPSYLTAWCEGKPDEGIGESVTFTLAEPVAVASLWIAAGIWHPDGGDVNRPTKLEITVSDGRKWDVAVADRRGNASASVEIGGAPVSSFTVKIVEVKAGKVNDTCLTSIGMWGADVDLFPAVGVTPEAVKALRGTVKKLRRALFKCDAKAMGALAGFPLDFVRAPLWDDNYEVSTPKRKKLATAAAFAKACRAGGSKFVDPPQENAYLVVNKPDQIDVKSRGNGPRPQLFHFSWNGKTGKDGKWTLTGVDWSERK